MRVGIGLAGLPFPAPRALFRWVDLCEESGVDSLWHSDRLVTPAPFLEAMSVMAALAGCTERMKFGMNAVVASLRDPLVLAKQCATVDYLSGGRLLPVFGVGNAAAPEWSATGRNPRERGARADEVLEIVRRLWSEESVSFEGKHYRYTEARIEPRPVQQPLPLWIGGSSPAAVRRTARVGTGWLGGLATPAQVAPVIQAIRAASRETGRPVPEDHYGATVLLRLGDPDAPAVGERLARLPVPDARALVAVGDTDAVLARLRAYREAGVTKFVVVPLVRDEADLLEQTHRLVDEVLPVAESWE